MDKQTLFTTNVTGCSLGGKCRNCGMPGNYSVEGLLVCPTAKCISFGQLVPAVKNHGGVSFGGNKPVKKLRSRRQTRV